jgi:hypothetical protein
VWNVKAHKANKIYLDVKHTFTNGGECKGWSPMNPKCAPTLGIAFLWELQMLKALIGKSSKHQIKPSGQNYKGLEA